MKALLITTIASFFALSVSAQVSTDTKVGTTTSTGTKQVRTERPAKVATSTTPALTSVNDNNNKVSSTRKDANTTAVETTPATRKEAPAGVTKEVKADNPGSQKLSTGRRDNTAPVKEDTPR